ncbi:MAG TPA: molybdate ABC transporter substrate-binding protein [Afipia sp.]
MLSGKLKNMTLGLTAVLLISSSLASQAQTISVGVAANFADPLADIILAFQAAYGGTTVNMTSKSTGALQADIIAGGTSGPYDLFLAANQTSPQYLVTSYSSLVTPYPSGNYPFHYTTGSLVLWSGNINPVNIDSGLPNPLTTNFVIADPANAPYGYAAMQVLNTAPWSLGLTPTSSYPVGYVHTATNIDTTFAAVAAGTYPYGFVAKSQVCSNDGSGEVWSGSHHHEYLYNDASHPYDQLVQYGVAINRSARTAPQTAVLQNFINYLLSNADAKAIIESYCYTFPAMITSKPTIKPTHKVKELAPAH